MAASQASSKHEWLPGLCHFYPRVFATRAFEEDRRSAKSQFAIAILANASASPRRTRFAVGCFWRNSMHGIHHVSLIGEGDA
jgi:hypothetical protein